MPTTYAVHGDVATELRELYPGGFNGGTTPTDTEVAARIAEVSTLLRVRMLRALGAEPAGGDDAATLIKRGVVAGTTAWVLRRLRTGYAAADVEALVRPYVEEYREVQVSIDMLPDLYRSRTATGHHVGATATTYQRDPVQADDAVGRTDTY